MTSQPQPNESDGWEEIVADYGHSLRRLDEAGDQAFENAERLAIEAEARRIEWAGKVAAQQQAHVTEAVETEPAIEGWTLEEFEAEPDPGPTPILCDGVMAQGGIHVVFGPASSCKSWAVLHLSCGLTSSGTSIGFAGLLDAPVIGNSERVLWVYGAEDSRRRVRYRAVEVARQYPLLDKKALKFVDATRTPVNTPEGRAWLEAQIQAHQATVVVVDTVSSCATVKAKDGDDVRDFLNAMHAILSDEANPTTDIILNHHSRKLSSQAREKGLVSEGADGLLGAGEWRNLTDDIVLLASKDGCPDDILVQVVKSKDISTTIGIRHVAWDVNRKQFTEIDAQPQDAPRTQARVREDTYDIATLKAIHFLGGTTSADELAKRQDLGVPAHKNTRANVIGRLIAADEIRIEGKGRWATYTLTQKGREALPQTSTDDID